MARFFFGCWRIHIDFALLFRLQKTYPLKGGKVATLQILAFNTGTQVRCMMLWSSEWS
jgi:hypothetical protein